MLDLTTKDMDWLKAERKGKTDPSCDTCAHEYEGKSKLPHVRVTCWDKQAEKSEYGFTGEIDWDQLYGGTFGEGAEVVIVTSDMKTNMVGICEISVMIMRDKYRNLGAWHEGLPPDLSGNYVVATESDIVAAIREHNKPKVPEWLKEGWYIKSGDESPGGRPAKVLKVIGREADVLWLDQSEVHYGPCTSCTTLDDLAVERNGVELWAYLDEDGDSYIVLSPFPNKHTGAYCNSYFTSDMDDSDDAMLFHALWDGPVIPYAQWLYLTKG